MYQDALWLFYTVRDDLEAPSNAYMEEDRSTVDTCELFTLLLSLKAHHCMSIGITRTKLRHHRCKERAAMPDPARRKDAQSDQNLDDVNRFPPPWDLQPLPGVSPSHRQ